MQQTIACEQRQQNILQPDGTLYLLYDKIFFSDKIYNATNHLLLQSSSFYALKHEH